MFQNLKNIFEKVKQENNSEVEIVEEEIYAVLSLLIEACKVDGIVSDDEIEKITSLLINKFHLENSKAKNAVNFVLEKANEKVEIFSDIKVILDTMDHEERIKVIEMLWGVVLADGNIDDYESNLMRKISSLLHVSSFETAEAKKRALN
ncbi:MAG: TerB family tellurite resistance protein [Alphaproteobacteria bacterium]|nr:MAG: TerB family tellurite resistance protein [Alphaproteobacteria bacterium]